MSSIFLDMIGILHPHFCLPKFLFAFHVDTKHLTFITSHASRNHTLLLVDVHSTAKEYIYFQTLNFLGNV